MPRYLRIGVASGSGRTARSFIPLDEEAFAAAASALRAAGVEAVAVAFLWSVVNDCPRAAGGRVVARGAARRQVPAVSRRAP